MFFVLSGFLITTLLVQEYQKIGSLSLIEFYRRRAARLLPALIMACAGFMLAIWMRDGREGLVQGSKDILFALSYLSNWARAFEWHSLYFLGHTWSLAVEEQFYLLWPLICLLCMRQGPSRSGFLLVFLPLLIALVSAFWRGYLALEGASVERLYNGLDTRLDGLMLGSALGFLWARGYVQKLHLYLSETGWRAIAAVSFAGILVFIASIELWFDQRLYKNGLLHIYQWLTAFFLLSLMGSQKGPCQKLLGGRLVVWLGTISYGIYIWHFPIYRFLQDAGLDSLAVLLIGGAMSLCIAQCSWLYVEKPLVNWARGKRSLSIQVPLPLVSKAL